MATIYNQKTLKFYPDTITKALKFYPDTIICNNQKLTFFFPFPTCSFADTDAVSVLVFHGEQLKFPFLFATCMQQDCLVFIERIKELQVAFEFL